MAKVYDALKRVEAERSRHPAAVVAMPRALAMEQSRGSGWSGWFGRREERSSPLPRAAAPDPALMQRLEHVAGAIELLKTRSAAPDLAPQLEVLVQQLGRVEIQVQAMDLEVARRVAAAVDPIAQRVGQLNTRVAWLLLTTLLALVVALARA